MVDFLAAGFFVVVGFLAELFAVVGFFAVGFFAVVLVPEDVAAAFGGDVVVAAGPFAAAVRVPAAGVSATSPVGVAFFPSAAGAGRVGSPSHTGRVPIVHFSGFCA